MEMTGDVVLERQGSIHHVQSRKNNDKLDIYLRREHPPYDVSTPKQERELTIENTDTIRGF